jgi:hypothetical protein
MNDPEGTDEYVLRRIPNKLSRKLSSTKLGQPSYPFLDFQDSTDVTYSQSESESGNFDGNDDCNDDMILRRLDASLSPRRMNELLGSGFVSKLVSSLRIGEGVSDLTLDAIESDDSTVNAVNTQQGSCESPGPSSDDVATATPSFRVTPKA